MRSSVVNRRSSVPRRAVLVKNAALTKTGVRSGQDTVAVRLGIGHGQSAYPDPVKATQPTAVLAFPVWRVITHQQQVAKRLAKVNLSSGD